MMTNGMKVIISLKVRLYYHQEASVIQKKSGAKHPFQIFLTSVFEPPVARVCILARPG